MDPLPKRVAIACGGTGGHLFPGIAVGDELVARGCEVMLLVSPKEVDQSAVKSAYGMEVESLSMIGLDRNPLKFGYRFFQSAKFCRKLFLKKRPMVVLAMGGFTSLPPVIVGKTMGAKIFLHEANAVPGRAVKMLSSIADEVFVQFPNSLPGTKGTNVRATGLPVRATMEPMPKSDARTVLGLDNDLPVLLIMGGSQGAEAINKAILDSLPYLAKSLPKIQFIHLTGTTSLEPIKSVYDSLGLRALVRPFLTEMEYALGAADLVISRAGASSLAEFSAMELPAILVPYPSAVDNHQRLNARTFVEMKAARCFHQKQLTPSLLTQQLKELFSQPLKLKEMGESIKHWKAESATENVVKRIYKMCSWEYSEEDAFLVAEHDLKEIGV